MVRMEDSDKVALCKDVTLGIFYASDKGKEAKVNILDLRRDFGAKTFRCYIIYEEQTRPVGQSHSVIQRHSISWKEQLGVALRIVIKMV